HALGPPIWLAAYATPVHTLNKSVGPSRSVPLLGFRFATDGHNVLSESHAKADLCCDMRPSGGWGRVSSSQRSSRPESLSANWPICRHRRAIPQYVLLGRGNAGRCAG